MVNVPARISVHAFGGLLDGEPAQSETGPAR
jgi:hypothetical protein